MSAHWCPDILFIWDDGVCDSLSYVRFRPGSYFSRTNTPRPNAWIAKAIQPSSISYASPVFSTLDLLFLYSSALGELCRRLDIDAREDVGQQRHRLFYAFQAEAFERSFMGGYEAS
ncbi:hypothetical protein CGMCC3_g16792 [Colletotrichum fructicola]|nr:uncharacterized protein CGMCC3_g16792 [Colletotrichum fructicola]KAE9567045.1 hypothetical protein CGMCC3_g16792 [Colletotrichum fructicola]